MITSADDYRDPPRHQHSGHATAVGKFELVPKGSRAYERNSALRCVHWPIIRATQSRQDGSIRDKGNAVARRHEITQVSLVLNALGRFLVFFRGG